MELIDKILSTDIHEAVEIYEDQIKKLGKELYGINCGSCGNRLIEIYIKLAKNGKEIMEHKINRTARLKEGVVLCVGDMGITWTNESLDFTDEAAVKVLKKYKAIESRFEVLPKGYEEPVKTERQLLLEEAVKLNLTHAKNITVVKLKELVEAKKAEEAKVELDLLKEEAVTLEIEVPEEIELDALKELIKAKKDETPE